MRKLDKILKKISKTLKQVQGDKSSQSAVQHDNKNENELKQICHPEFISGSDNKKMLKQVQHDKLKKKLAFL